MEQSTVIDTLQPIAHLAYHVGTAARAFTYSMRFEPKFDDYRHELLPASAKLLAALKEFSTQSQTISQPYLPSMFDEPLTNARKEADEVIKALDNSCEPLKEYVENAEVSGPEAIFTLRATCNNFNVRDHESTIRLFEDTYARASRGALDPWGNNYAFHIDETGPHIRRNESGYGGSEDWKQGSRPMTKNFNGPNRLKYIVEAQETVSEEEFQGLLKRMPNGGTGKLSTDVYEDREYLGYHVGLTVRERMLLALNPKVKKVRIYYPALSFPEGMGAMYDRVV